MATRPVALSTIYTHASKKRDSFPTRDGVIIDSVALRLHPNTPGIGTSPFTNVRCGNPESRTNGAFRCDHHIASVSTVASEAKARSGSPLGYP